MRLTKKTVDLAIVVKLQKKTKDEKEKSQCQFHENMSNEARRDACKKVAARRIEEARIKQLKELQKNINIISNEMFQSISDLEIE
jgi:hypothetical protein